ncbi:MAG: response regulator [Bacillota bacterium]|nr:response regulator [Bacillota bacterium]
MDSVINPQNFNKSESSLLANRLVNIMHELRTPMIGILGSVELLEQEPILEEQTEHIQTIRTCGEQLLQTINEILNVSTIELGLTTSPPRPADLLSSATDQKRMEHNQNILHLETLQGLYSAAVLIVEDNSLNQKLISKILLNYGFEVSTAVNGAECLTQLANSDFDIILMDMQMPVMDGYETTRRIRSTPAWSRIPIIAVTANAFIGDEKKCLDCGCSSYLAKPFRTEDLIEEIKNHIQVRIKNTTAPTLFSDEIIHDLLPEFLESLDKMLADLKASIASRDFSVIIDTSHAIKGTAGMYGFGQLSKLAFLMEQAARDKAVNKIDMLFTQLSSSVSELNLVVNY